MQSVAAVLVMPLLIFFAAYTAVMTRSDFQWTGQHPKIALSPWGSGLLFNYIGLVPKLGITQMASRLVQT